MRTDEGKRWLRSSARVVGLPCLCRSEPVGGRVDEGTAAKPPSVYYLGFEKREIVPSGFLTGNSCNQPQTVGWVSGVRSCPDSAPAFPTAPRRSAATPTKGSSASRGGWGPLSQLLMALRNSWKANACTNDRSFDPYCEGNAPGHWGDSNPATNSFAVQFQGFTIGTLTRKGHCTRDQLCVMGELRGSVE